MRQFATGATRNVDANKPDPEGFFSPLVIHAFNEYMNKNRIQADGKIRESDNWQKGIPIESYMKSLWRHFLDVWTAHRKIDSTINIKESLCAMMFNVMGYLHEIEKQDKQKIIYLACPYSHTSKKIRGFRFRICNRIGGKLMSDGFIVFSPISHTHPISLESQLPTDWEFWKSYDEAFLKMCQSVYVIGLPGWKESKGVTAEIEIARNNNIPIFLITGIHPFKTRRI